MSCSVKDVPLFDSQTVHAELFFASSLDRHQSGPKVSPKLADARKMKRLADLALLAGSPLDVFVKCADALSYFNWLIGG